MQKVRDPVSIENAKFNSDVEKDKSKNKKLIEIQTKIQRKEIFERELASRFKDQMEEYLQRMDHNVQEENFELEELTK